MKPILNNCKQWSLYGFNDQSIGFINSLYSKEPYPVFEHNKYHILSYLKFNNELFAVENKYWKSILISQESKNKLFTPMIVNVSEFINDLKTSNIESLEIINVSQEWIKNNFAELKNNFNKVDLISRSKEEAVYDLDVLSELSGSQFAKLRNTKNKLITNQKLIFKKLNTQEDLEQAKELINIWNLIQGYKYSKDKKEKEKYVLECLVSESVNDKNLIVEMGFVEGKPLCIVVYFLSPTHDKWSEIYMVKGINRTSDQGLHGISDAAYLHVFNELKKMGAKYANDGELGSEEGTRNHKLRFQPCMFLQSFDLNIHL